MKKWGKCDKCNGFIVAGEDSCRRCTEQAKQSQQAIEAAKAEIAAAAAFLQKGRAPLTKPVTRPTFFMTRQGMVCPKCLRLPCEHYDAQGRAITPEKKCPQCGSTDFRCYDHRLCAKCTEKEEMDPKPYRYEVSEMRTCVKCEAEFDPKDPANQAGKYNECGECAGKDVTPYTGVMIVGGKTGMEIQINTDPRVTEYIKNASAHHGTAPAVVTRKESGTVKKIVTGLENRRHGDSK